MTKVNVALNLPALNFSRERLEPRIVAKHFKLAFNLINLRHLSKLKLLSKRIKTRTLKWRLITAFRLNPACYLCFLTTGQKRFISSATQHKLNNFISARK